MRSLSKTIRNNTWLLLIILLALILRLIGITHGYPYIFNIDEPALVRSTLGLRYSFIVEHFDWPHFNFYFNYLFYWIFIKARAVVQMLNLRTTVETAFPLLWNDPFVFYWISRVISALLGALTVIPVYLLARNIYGARKYGLIAALFFSVMPLHVENSHYALQDVSLLFWLMWGIYYMFLSAGQALSADRRSILIHVLAGIFLGIATGHKYNAVIFGLIYPIFFIVSRISRKQHSWQSLTELIKGGFIILLSAIITFVITTFSLIKKWDIFYSYEYGRGLLWQLTENVHQLSWSEYLNVVPQKLLRLSVDMGPALTILMILGGVFSIRNFYLNKVSDKKHAYLTGIFIMIVAYILYILKYNRAGGHYFLPVYGLVAVLAVAAVRSYWKVITPVAFVSLFAASLYADYLLLNPGTERIAMDYYAQATNAGHAVYFNNSESISTANSINNLGIKRLTSSVEPNSGDRLITEAPASDDDRIYLVEKIGNTNRNGQIIYIYEYR